MVESIVGLGRVGLKFIFILLDPLAGDHGPYDSHWQLRLNRTQADLSNWLVH